MRRSLIIAVLLGAVAGLGATSVWEAEMGTATGVLVALIGAVASVLRRNKQDLDEMRRRMASDDVDTVLEDEE